jgi:hypothetical protein
MGSKSRTQEYPYLYKEISIVNSTICGYGPWMTLYFPDNMRALKSIWMRIAIVFANDEPINNQTINNILLYNTDTPIGGKPFNANKVPVNISATNSVIDYSIDLQSQIPNFTILTDAEDRPYTLIGLEMPLLYDTHDNEITLWKIDYIYTTQGIR